MSATASLKERLQLSELTEEICADAVAGKAVPYRLGMPWVRLCVIRGIRYHTNFASELRGADPVFTRALNAREIMSNIIPNMENPDEQPYCIWHPDVAEEKTYRKLALKYPSMRYQVGRACAVAGYFQLYQELDLLPDTSIAEEARESGDKGREIFDHIIAQPRLYAVMDDYKRAVNISSPRANAVLNGDTCARYLLDIKHRHPFWVPYLEDIRYHPPPPSPFDITEDKGIDAFDSEPHFMSQTAIDMLYSPLPTHLPTIDKDAAIFVAAYYGQIDRYARLRRPVIVPNEFECVIRGIYHNTFFAKWWTSQPLWEDPTGWIERKIQNAITARFIMNDDLSRVTGEETDAESLPYCIWFPDTADRETYRTLAKRQPLLVLPIVRAAIHMRDQKLYDEFIGQVAEPDLGYLWTEARDASAFVTHFLDDLKHRESQRKDEGEYRSGFDYKGDPTQPTRFRAIPGKISASGKDWVHMSQGLYDGIGVDLTAIEHAICIPDSVRLAVAAKVQWPRTGNHFEPEDLYRV